jgi:serine protease
LVAVIDDGIVSDHPDLAPQLYSAGRAFISVNTEGDADRTSAENLATAADQPVFHGTHVAGTVGAATFDGIGGAGTAPMAQLLPLRVFPANSGARTIDVIAAMRYAAALSNRTGFVPNKRADVINMSLGSDNPCDGAYRTAIADVRAAGTIVVVAAGNSGRNNSGVRAAVGSPANCTGAIAVSATDARRKIANYSSTGSEVVVAGPGGDASVSTTGSGAPDNVYSDIGTFDANGQRQPAFGGMQGTSMASPHVAGVMALMRYVNPQLTVAQVDTLLSTTGAGGITMNWAPRAATSTMATA